MHHSIRQLHYPHTVRLAEQIFFTTIKLLGYGNWPAMSFLCLYIIPSMLLG